jgi:hypothetical protein
MHKRPDLIEGSIHPGLDDAHESLMEVFEEMQGQLEKEMSRLDELRQIREQDPGGRSFLPFFSFGRSRVRLVSLANARLVLHC